MEGWPGVLQIRACSGSSIFTSLRMTGVAGLGIVDVPGDALMLLVGASAVMAAKTAEDLVVGWIDMAFRTVEIGVSARIDGEFRMQITPLAPVHVGSLMTELAVG